MRDFFEDVWEATVVLLTGLAAMAITITVAVGTVFLGLRALAYFGVSVSGR